MLEFCSRSRLRSGLTLIELVVVLAILIVLAGLVVPRLRNYFFKAHGSGCVANITEIAKWWELCRIEEGNYSRYPNRLDNLCQSDNALYGLLLSSMSLRLSAYPLTAGDVSVLANAGLTRVIVPDAVQPAPPNRNATLFVGAQQTLAAGSTVAIVNPATPEGLDLLNQLGQDPATLANFRYYVFGIGSQCSAVGNVMIDAPTHITEAGDPTVRYNRYGDLPTGIGQRPPALPRGDRSRGQRHIQPLRRVLPERRVSRASLAAPHQQRPHSSPVVSG